MDALTARYKGELAATQYQREAELYEYEAKSAKSSQSLVPIQTALSAGTSLLSGYARSQGVKV
jgi:hypothetical protein